MKITNKNREAHNSELRKGRKRRRKHRKFVRKANVHFVPDRKPHCIISGYPSPQEWLAAKMIGYPDESVSVSQQRRWTSTIPARIFSHHDNASTLENRPDENEISYAARFWTRSTPIRLKWCGGIITYVKLCLTRQRVP